MLSQGPDFGKRGGLIVVIIQDYETKEVLMQGYANQEAWEKTLATQEVWLWSTSRNKLWYKGATSNGIMTVKKIALDCDADSALFEVVMLQGQNACHLGRHCCFTTYGLPECN